MKTRAALVLCAAISLLSLLPTAALAQSNAACARTVTVVAGDTLTDLADTYLDNPLAYPRIVAATNAAAEADGSYATVDDEGRIVIGWKLCIPGATVQAATSAAPAASEGGGPTTSSSAAAAINAAGSAVTSDVFTFDGEKLTIDYLRKQKYPGSDIVIEETLDPGANYDRYIVVVPLGGAQAVRAADRAAGRATRHRLAGDHLQPRLHPARVYRTTERYVAYVDGFARNGYIVFRPDYRGHASRKVRRRRATATRTTRSTCSTPWLGQAPGPTPIRTASACGAIRWAATSRCARW